MAVLELLESPQYDEAPVLRLVEPALPAYLTRTGRSVVERRNARRRARLLRRRAALVGVVLASIVVLLTPGTVFGSTAASGASVDVVAAGALTPGTLYVVHAGDTVERIARLVNPVNPELARRAIVHTIGSSIVTPGEHIVIP